MSDGLDGQEGQNPRLMQDYVRLYNAGYSLYQIQQFFEESQRPDSTYSVTSSGRRSCSQHNQNSPPLERYRDTEEGWRDSSTLSDGEWSTEEDETGEKIYPRGESRYYPSRTTSRHYLNGMPRKPLINQVRNDWRHNPKYSYDRNHWPESDMDAFGPSDCLEIICAKKIRRLLGLCATIIVLFWISWFAWLSPKFNEHLLLKSSLDYRIKSGNGWFGTNVRPKFADMIQLKTLDPSLIPGLKRSEDRRKRLIIIGDIHGCLTECTLSPSLPPPPH